MMDLMMVFLWVVEVNFEMNFEIFGTSEKAAHSRIQQNKRVEIILVACTEDINV